MTGQSPFKSARQAPGRSHEPTTVKAFSRDVKAGFWAILADVIKLAFAFGAWKAIDLLLLQLFGANLAGDARVFSSIAHWGTMLTIVGPRFLTVLTEILALTFRLLRTIAAGMHGVWFALTTGKVDPEEST